jgi:hypothetical protein
VKASGRRAPIRTRRSGRQWWRQRGSYTGWNHSCRRIWPGTGPQYLLCAQFGVPAVGLGVGNADSNNHAPNENIAIDDYLQGSSIWHGCPPLRGSLIEGRFCFTSRRGGQLSDRAA